MSCEQIEDLSQKGMYNMHGLIQSAVL